MSVAIIKDSRLVSEYTTHVKKNHSVQLMPAIQRMMEEAKLQPNELDRIAVAHGPGSFTGVRIGLTTAKTLAWTLGIPVVALSSLEVMAFRGATFGGKVSPFFDARRGQVYTGLYHVQHGEVSIVGNELNVPMTEWLEKLKGEGEPVLFLSSDLEVHREAIQETMGDLALFPIHGEVLPSAGELGLAAMTKEPTPVHELTPNYLRLAEAESKWLAQQEEKKQHDE